MDSIDVMRKKHRYEYFACKYVFLSRHRRRNRDGAACFGGRISPSGTPDGSLYARKRRKELQREKVRGIEVFRGAAGKTELDFGPSVTVAQRICRWITKAYNIRIPKELNTVIDEFSPDVVHVNNPFYMSTIVWKTAAKRKIPVLHTTHDYYLLRKDSYKDRILYRFSKMNAKYVSRFTGPSDCIVREFVRDGLFSGKIAAVVPNGLHMEPEVLLRNKELKRRRSEHDPVIFLYAGQLTEEKGVHKMLEAWSGIERPDIRLLISGKGKLEETCRHTAESDPRIELCGFLPAGELEKMYMTGGRADRSVCMEGAVRYGRFGSFLSRAAGDCRQCGRNEGYRGTRRERNFGGRIGNIADQTGNMYLSFA